MKAMHKQKDKLVSQPILALPNAEGRYNLDTNACNTQVENV